MLLTQNGSTPLHIAYQAERVEMVMFLLGSGADIEQENKVCVGILKV